MWQVGANLGDQCKPWCCGHADADKHEPRSQCQHLRELVLIVRSDAHDLHRNWQAIPQEIRDALAQEQMPFDDQHNR